MRVVGDAERRARMAKRHGLAPGHHYPDVATAAQAMVAWHATEAATVHLAVRARTDGVEVKDIEAALYEERSLVKQLAMRRTLWAFPDDLLPAVWGSASRRVAIQQRARMLRDLDAHGVATDPEAWLERATAEVLELLSDGEPRTTAQIRAALPSLEGRVVRGDASKKWGGSVPIGPRVLTVLGAEGRIVRAQNAGHWRLNRPTWTTTDAWLPEAPAPTSEADGYAELVRRWLWTFGPGTEADLVWWLGATKAAVRGALAAVGAVRVELTSATGAGEQGWALPDDPIATTPEEPVAPWAALLPTLDPSVMGWKQRGFYLPPEHVPYLFDINGNAGNTAWWDGRVVGCWVQDEEGEVRVVLGDGEAERVGEEGRAALDAEATRLTGWLDGVVITNVYASARMKQARQG